MFTVYLDQTRGAVCPLHGVNLGPIERHYAYDYSDYYRKVRIPSIRTHDCNRTAMDIVDLHDLFPIPDADPTDPKNYRFELTDDYLAKIRDVGAEIYFRLGESIEGRGMPRKMYVVAGRWKPEILAQVCVNIARHYTEGWSNGFKWDHIQWQFWNEPSNCYVLPPEQRPCWTGTANEFYQLYGAVARAMKRHNPAWKIGLAGYGRPDFVFPVGHPLYREDNPWRHIEDIVNSGPIDTISWHQYGDSWENLKKSADMVRDCLDANGLAHAENHLTEWNYSPWLEDEKGRYTWFHARQERDFDRLDTVAAVIGGAEGAAYVFGAFASFQETSLVRAHHYTGVSSGALGLFTPHGRPYKKFTAFEVFSEFLDQDRVRVDGGVPDRLTAMATVHEGTLRIAIAHLKPAVKEVTIRLECAPQMAANWRSRQFLEAGWSDIDVHAANEGGGWSLTVPIGGSGLTILTRTL